MNKKQNIQIAVIVLFFAAAIFVLYKGGLFGGGSSAALPATQKAAVSSEDILPNGDSLDFKSVINSSRFQYNILQYPQLSPQSDVGVPENILIAHCPR